MHALFYFLIALALLIVVHEYGHFWVARRCGVKVLRFSVGFGKPIWSKIGKDGTEYVVAMLPFGGYVKMLDEREGDVPVEQLHQTFNRQPLRSRMAIVAAGPLANLAFAVVAYWLVLVVGIPGIKPIIDTVQPGSLAQQAQFAAGEQFVSINGEQTPTWDAVYKNLLTLAEKGGEANVKVNSGGMTLLHQIEVPKLSADKAPSIFKRLGIEPVSPKLIPIVGFVQEDGPAAHAGIQKGDRLVSVNGKHIDTWMGWVKFIQQHPDKDLTITIQRQHDYIDVSVKPDKDKKGEGKIGVGVDASQTPIPSDLKATLRYNPVSAISESLKQTWQFTSSTLQGILGMLEGTVSTKNLGGPITIARIAGSAADHGFVAFVNFLAMISISLGILNLLPIPVLDGGYLAMYVYEWLRGAPLSEKAQMQGQKLGLMLLLMLMLLAFYNDLSRLFG